MDRKPLVVVDRDGVFVTLGSMNAKAYSKSVESGELWVIHDETSKVLPAEPRMTYATLLDQGAFFEARLPGTAAHPIVSPSSDSRKAAAAKRSGSASNKTDAAMRNGAEKSGTGIAETLSRLAEVIAQRKRDLPEGSYTTYLFKEGIEKIRKKTGEEAVELILARKPSDVTWEAADLIYHLLVLLSAEGIGLDDVAAELEKRAR